MDEHILGHIQSPSFGPRPDRLRDDRQKNRDFIVVEDHTRYTEGTTADVEVSCSPRLRELFDAAVGLEPRMDKKRALTEYMAWVVGLDTCDAPRLCDCERLVNARGEHRHYYEYSNGAKPWCQTEAKREAQKRAAALGGPFFPPGHPAGKDEECKYQSTEKSTNETLTKSPGQTSKAATPEAFARPSKPPKTSPATSPPASNASPGPSRGTKSSGAK